MHLIKTLVPSFLLSVSPTLHSQSICLPFPKAFGDSEAGNDQLLGSYLSPIFKSVTNISILISCSCRFLP